MKATKPNERPSESRLSKIVSTAVGVSTGAGLTALGMYNPELALYASIGAAAVGAGVVAGVGGVINAYKSKNLARFGASALLTSAAMVGGYQIGRNDNSHTAGQCYTVEEILEMIEEAAN